MKKLLCVILSVVFFCSCSNALDDAVTLFTNDENVLLTHAVFYNDNDDVATLNSKDGKYYVNTRSADGKETTLYTLEDGNYAYELYANDGLIAFFERCIYSNRDERCTLKVIDTENGEVYAPFSKVIVYEDYDVQSRFIEIDGDDVYYITSSFTLGETRIMKYTLGAESPVEFTTLALTQNDFTYDHSITCFDIDDGKLICACLDGYSNVIQIFDLESGVCEKKKLLPANVGVVYSIAYSNNTAETALYYSTVSTDGKIDGDYVGVIKATSENINVLYTLEDGEYVNRETVSFDGEYVCFNIQTKTDISYDNFKGMMIGINNKKALNVEGSMQTFTKDGKLYNMLIDENDDKKISFVSSIIK